jgi:hypothetical protein
VNRFIVDSSLFMIAVEGAVFQVDQAVLIYKTQYLAKSFMADSCDLCHKQPMAIILTKRWRGCQNI